MRLESSDNHRVHVHRARVPLVILLAVVLVLAISGTALAADRWNDITDQQWIDMYGVTAAEVDTVADGYPDGSFRPANMVTREQFAKMAVDGLGIATLTPLTPSFSDVPTTHAFYRWIEGAAAEEIISGYADGTFRPSNYISREQTNSILGLYLSQHEIQMTGSIAGDDADYPSLAAWHAAEGQEFLAAFADSGSVASVHAPATAYLVARGVVKGNQVGAMKYLMPKSNLSRAQAAVMILRTMDASESLALPTVTALAPTAGPTAGGNSVVITGTGFTGLSGAAAVKFGATNATSYVVDSPTQITAVAPAHVAGTVDVTVTTPAGTSAANAGSKYTYGPPTITALNPAAGTVAGGNAVVITGTGFTGLSGAAAVKFGATNATSYVVDSPTQITAVAPAHTAGTVDVTVTTPAGTSAASAASKYSYGPPTVTDLDPSAGSAAGGNSVVITGTGFTGLSGAAAVKFGATNATSYVVNSPTQITAVAPAHAVGTVDVTVTTPAGTSAASAASKYTYGGPTVTNLNPAAGPTAGGNTVIITGTGFTGLVGPEAVKFGNTDATSYTVNSSTQITAKAPAHLAGVVDVRVTTSAGISGTSAASKYTFGVPTITEVDPGAGAAAGGNTVVITGTGFTGLSGAAAVKFGDTNATSYVVDSPTQITAIAPAHALGTVDVKVTNAAGASVASLASKYTFGGPAVTDLNPDAGPSAGGNTVVITGTGFTGLTGGSAVRFGSVKALSYVVDSPTQITAVAPPHAAGVVDVTVTTPADTSDANADSKYTFWDPPIVTGLNPSHGPETGGTLVTVSGANFSPSSTVKFGSKSATQVTVVNTGTITCKAPSGTGVVDVIVKAVGGESDDVAADDFTYISSQVSGIVRGQDGSLLAGAVVTIRVFATDPLYDPVDNLVGTAVANASGEYLIELTDFGGSPLPTGTHIEVSASCAGYLAVTQHGIYSQDVLECSFLDYTADGEGDRRLPVSDGTPPPFPFSGLMPNDLS